MSSRAARRTALVSSVAVACLAALVGAPRGGAADPVAVPQGPDWTPATRAQFYSQDQGSQIMPLVWFEALKQPDGEPFAGDGLARYG
jgi:hypothetical protein